MLPKGIKTSGFPAVDRVCRELGLHFDQWQTDLNRCILAKDSAGLYAADTVVISIPRQVGKTWDIGALVFALCIINPGITVVWTAHRFKVARETFMALKGIALSAPLAAHVDPEAVYTAAGNESITFRNGSRIVFAARERGAVRGFSEVEILVLDEGQILSEAAMSDLAPTTNQAKNPLIIVMGTPPKPTDPGEVFTRLRREALAGESEDVLFVEFSAPADADPDDRAAWKIMNPSYPKRTSAKAILRMRKLLSLEDFIREAMGKWDDVRLAGVFTVDTWANRATKAKPPPVAALGLALDIDRVWLSLGAASEGETPHLGSVLRVRLDQGRTKMLDEVERITKANTIPVAVDAKGPAASLIPDLEERGVTVLHGGLDDYVQACADLFDAVESGGVTHGNYDDLNAAVAAAGWRKVGERRVWSRKSGDTSMLEAVTWAKWGATQEVASIYETQGLVTL